MVNGKDLLQSIVSACYGASQIIFEVANGVQDLEIHDKSQPAIHANNSTDKQSITMQDPQTLADRKAESYIMSFLRSRHPGLAIFGEETTESSFSCDEFTFEKYYSLPEKALEQSKKFLSINFPPHLDSLSLPDLQVWVDPLDGTSDFTKKDFEGVTTLIGVVYKEKPLFGAIGVPFPSSPEASILYWSWVDHTPSGYYHLSQQGTVRHVKPSISALKEGKSSGKGGEEKQEEKTVREEKRGEETAGEERRGKETVGEEGRGEEREEDVSIRLILTKSRMDPFIESCAKALQPKEILLLGGSGAKILQVLLGKADVYLYPVDGTKLWDVCAGDALLRSMGGRVADIFQEDIVYNSSRIRNRRGVFAYSSLEERELRTLEKRLQNFLCLVSPEFQNFDGNTLRTMFLHQTTKLPETER